MRQQKKTVLPVFLPTVQTFGTVYARLVLPVEALANLSDAVQLQAESLSPFDDGEEAVSYELLGQSESELFVFVAIASIASLETPWHDYLVKRDAVGSLRLDLSSLGWLRGMKARRPALEKGLHFVALRTSTEQLVALLENGQPLALRALPPEASDEDFLRESMFVLTQSAIAGNGGELESIVCFAKDKTACSALTSLLGTEPELDLLPTDEAAEALLQHGLHLRAESGATFDLTPTAWKVGAKQAKALHLLIVGGIALAALWVLCAIALFMMPRIYKHLANTAELQLSAHRKSYEEVLELRERVNLIERYQDRSHSALEILRLICDAKNEGMTFLSLTYRQKQSVRLSGTTEATADVYAFKEKLQKDNRIAEVKITRLVQDNRSLKQRFDIEITFRAEEVE
ncbi:MAG: hypothetical protein RR133_06145 [Kiritimatiellia bacterium]